MKAGHLRLAAVSVGAFALSSTPALRGQAATDSVVAVTAVEDAYGHWSPDGRRIVFQSNRTGQWDIFVIDADGSTLRRLTDHPAHDRTPVWSPDGRLVAYRGGLVLDTLAGTLRRVERPAGTPEHWSLSAFVAPDLAVPVGLPLGLHDLDSGHRVAPLLEGGNP